jgi:hypothetical protein
MKRATTIKQPELLNAKVITIPTISPIFQKLSLSVDLNKAKTMIRNVLPPNQLINFYDEKRKFWDSNDENCSGNSEKVYYTIDKQSMDILKCKIRRELLFLQPPTIDFFSAMKINSESNQKIISDENL